MFLKKKKRKGMLIMFPNQKKTPLPTFQLTQVQNPSPEVIPKEKKEREC
jgi:hypothetical protein